MSVHRVVWALAVAATTLVGALATMGSMSQERAVATTLTTSAVGATLGYALSKDLPGRHPVLAGAALFGWPTLVMPGLVHLLGPWALAVAGVLLVASPYVVGFIARGLHRTARQLESSDVEWAALADEDEPLRRQWLASTALLETVTTDEDRLVVVQARSQILDDLSERWGAQLPDYVWASLHGRADNGGQKPGAEQER